MKEIEFEWEEINNNSKIEDQNWFEATYRAKVFGGWLIRHEICNNYSYELEDGDEGYLERRNNLIFIPDCMHDWKIK